MRGELLRIDVWRQGNNENAKLIAEEAVLKVGESNKIRELYRIMNEIPETEKGRTANQERS